LKNAFTIDLEDWYQGIGLPINQWETLEKRLEVGTYKILTLLEKHKTNATFFVVGKILEEYPQVIKDIIKAGHEIACHTYTHPFLYNITPLQFQSEIIKCNKLLEENFNIKNEGFRAPFFSVDNRSLWALDILKEQGYIYDSSIYPGDNKRTGIVGYKKEIHTLENGLIEIPLSTFKVHKFDVGLGGAYFRILPYFYFKKKFKQINDAGRPGIFYIHPWELDPKHPYIGSLPSRIKYPHYFNLSTTHNKIKRLLNDFEFVTMKQLLMFNN
jgi:polysaccharide deacetylase family protein (PEP-CTERM system associated)